ncbi:MAG: KEOPS complex subunit Cgi121 [Candidatus Bathyarchaeota archaeon]|nr:KEOPS complex subunit Cgi121 [Candidatus Bathyarchaeota archaeon]
MLKHLEEFGKYVEIGGFKKTQIGDAKAFSDNVRGELPAGVEVQLFDADLVATWQHLYFAALNALTAFRNERNLSKSLAVETALYASAQRQIKKALDLIGLKPESTNTAVMLIGDAAESVETGFSTVTKHMGVKRDDSVLELSQAKRRRIREVFDVSDDELSAVFSDGDGAQALVALVVERAALLSTRL